MRPNIRSAFCYLSIGLFIMAGLYDPLLAVLGRDTAALPFKKDIVDMLTIAHNKEFREAGRNIYA
jgi:hypothetical protein